MLLTEQLHCSPANRLKTVMGDILVAEVIIQHPNLRRRMARFQKTEDALEWKNETSGRVKFPTKCTVIECTYQLAIILMSKRDDYD